MTTTKEKRATSATPADSRLILRWKRLLQQETVIKPQIATLRAKLLEVAKQAGADAIHSKHGTIQMQRTRTLDVGELKRRLCLLISAPQVEAIVEACMRTSEPYLVAPREWGAEIRTAAQLAGAE